MSSSDAINRLLTALAFILLGSVFVFLWAAERASHYPDGTEKYCETSNTGHEHCVTYDEIAVPFLKIAKFLDVYSSIITALSGVAVAVFTGTLWWVTWGMVNLAREQRSDLLRSIRAAEDAARATQLSVKAAIRSARAAEEASHVERAWLFFDSIIRVGVVDGIVDNGPTQNGHLIGIQWRNGGRSPAIKVALSCDARLVNSNDPVPVFVNQIIRPAYAIIGQGTTTQTPRIFINDEDYMLIKTRKKQLYFHSRVEYFDVFENEVLRASDFTGMVEFVDITHHITHEKGVSVRISSVGEQNTAT